MNGRKVMISSEEEEEEEERMFKQFHCMGMGQDKRKKEMKAFGRRKWLGERRFTVKTGQVPRFVEIAKK